MSLMTRCVFRVSIGTVGRTVNFEKSLRRGGSPNSFSNVTPKDPRGGLNLKWSLDRDGWWNPECEIFVVWWKSKVKMVWHPTETLWRYRGRILCPRIELLGGTRNSESSLVLRSFRKYMVLESVPRTIPKAFFFFFFWNSYPWFGTRRKIVVVDRLKSRGSSTRVYEQLTFDVLCEILPTSPECGHHSLSVTRH